MVMFGEMFARREKLQLRRFHSWSKSKWWKPCISSRLSNRKKNSLVWWFTSTCLYLSMTLQSRRHNVLYFLRALAKRGVNLLHNMSITDNSNNNVELVWIPCQLKGTDTNKTILISGHCYLKQVIFFYRHGWGELPKTFSGLSGFLLKWIVVMKEVENRTLAHYFLTWCWYGLGGERAKPT